MLVLDFSCSIIFVINSIFSLCEVVLAALDCVVVVTVRLVVAVWIIGGGLISF